MFDNDYFGADMLDTNFFDTNFFDTNFFDTNLCGTKFIQGLFLSFFPAARKREAGVEPWTV